MPSNHYKTLATLDDDPYSDPSDYRVLLHVVLDENAKRTEIAQIAIATRDDLKDENAKLRADKKEIREQQIAEWKRAENAEEERDQLRTELEKWVGRIERGEIAGWQPCPEARKLLKK